MDINSVCTHQFLWGYQKDLCEKFLKPKFNVYQRCGGNPGQVLSVTVTFIYGISPLHVQKPERSGNANKLKNYRIEHTRSNSIEKTVCLIF